MAVMTGADVYGNAANQFVGMKSQTTAISASGAIGNEENTTPNTNASFSWVVFVLVLVFIRVLESLAPSI